MRAIRRFTVRPVLPEPLAPLGELVANLRWSWHAETMDLLASVDTATWRTCGQDPARLLAEVPRDRLASLAGDRRFLRRLQDAADELTDYLTGDRWYQTLPTAPEAIAYFSPEFGITEVLPQYSGGLGILAGDHLKAASDLGVPIIGVGLLYRRGYFRQSLSREGWQQERYPVVDPNALPLAPLGEDTGDLVKVTVGLPDGRRLVAQVWKAQVGRVPLLLLDSEVEDNEPAERDVTDRLYGGGSEHRLLQEMLLGIGGVRAVRAYCALTGGPTPEVFHTNEGHAGFLGIERIRELTDDHGLDFAGALAQARAGTVFTTHTPVPAGIDRFPRELVAAHFGGDNARSGVPVDRLLELGLEPSGGDPGVFNMAVMGMRLAQRANGVSVLHGAVSREMFAGLWPGFDHAEVPIGSITNGVHAPTWVAKETSHLALDKSGSATAVNQPEAWAAFERVSDADLWQLRRTLRARLVQEVRERLRDSWLQRGASEAELGWVDSVLDPEVLTLGFARRVPAYKRLTLMLRDPKRLTSLLLHPERPIQLVIAGKAHPADDGGKRLIQEIVRFSDDPEVRRRIVFLPNYDIGMARHLVSGTDVWLNNPLRPQEACGTSGMKAALNGGLNLSIRDGWWDEWFDGENGWAIPSAEGVSDDDRRDDLEAAALLDLIEASVAKRFYDRDAAGLPVRWLEMVRHTLQSLGPKVLASRMVRDYVTGLYAPAAVSSRQLAEDSFSGARELARWQQQLRAGWDGVRVEHVESSAVGEATQLGSTVPLRAVVSLGSLSPDDVEVQATYGGVDERDELVAPAFVSLQVAERYDDGRYRYEGEVPADRPGSFGYTVRALPSHPLLSAMTDPGLVALPVTAPVDMSADLR